MGCRSVLVSVLAVLALLLCAMPVSEAGTDVPGLYGVYPVGDGVVIGPLSPGQDLKDYSVRDGSGRLTFNQSFVPSESYVLVAPKADTRLPDSYQTVIAGEYGLTKSGSFSLNDKGDSVSLYKSETLIETVCYGTSSGADGWTGPAVGIGSGKHLIRTGEPGSAAGWVLTKDGWTNIPEWSGSYVATVTPFTFPESCGAPVLQALEDADTSIVISIYLLSSRNTAALLESKAAAGVDVRILLEGSPLGTNIVSGELPLMKAVADAGGDIRLINNLESTRYTYLHNKYAVIDGDTVVLTSENWTGGNIGNNGNRGWGAVIESPEYASFMLDVFENDFSKDYGDVTSLCDAYTNLVADHAFYESPAAFSGESYTATVSPVLSPDNSWDSMRDFIGSATTRVYSEQLDLGSNLCDASGDNPVSWMAARASEGLDVRFILDAHNNTDAHMGYVDTVNATTAVKAQAVNGRSGFDLIHNKGVICDGAVWVGSVNWTSNSFLNNRETAVVIRSPEIADYFVGYYIADWGVTIDTVRENGMGFRVNYNESEGVVELIALVPDGYEVLFELGDGTERTSARGYSVFDAPSAGKYRARATIVGTDISEEFSYEVARDGIPVSWIIYAAAACILLLGTILAVRRERSNARRRGRRGGNTRHASRRR